VPSGEGENVKKRELQALVEAQAAEIAALRRRVEALEARPPITIAAPEMVSGGVTLTPCPVNIYWAPGIQG